MTVMPVEQMLRTPPALSARAVIAMRVAGWLIAAVLVVGLFGRIMTYPLSHDEQIHVVAARLIFQEPLYGTLGYNHLPGLPLLLHAFYVVTGSDHWLQAGRVLIFLCWAGTAALMWRIGERLTKDARLGIVAMLVLAAGELIGPAGMLVTNNFLPIPFALLGFHLFVIGLDEPDIRPLAVFGAGAAIGFAILLKISYVFLLPPVLVAAIAVPSGLDPIRRLRLVLLPLALGGLVGGLPALVVLASDPQMLLAHTVRYFTTGHLGYWQHSAEPKAMSLAAKMAVAEDVWFSGSGLLALLLAGVAGWTMSRENKLGMRWWPLGLAVALALFAALGGFAPTPAFPQYYEPPIPFVVVAFLVAYGLLDPQTRQRLAPLVGMAALLALAILLPRLAPTMVAAAHPARWTGNVLHDQGQRIRATLIVHQASGKVATLSPIVALEGGLPIYREFGAGPFVYRVADYLLPADRARFTTTSPARLASFLDTDPPGAIITGREDALDPPFVAYARARGYIATETGDPQTQLFLRPMSARP